MVTFLPVSVAGPLNWALDVLHPPPATSLSSAPDQCLHAQRLIASRAGISSLLKELGVRDMIAASLSVLPVLRMWLNAA